ncbi:Aminopeptidase N [Eumeta japonica]|uniref:Aminopeptidase N n=1 Tax=Eumeta variegata TaxID=151549 RepID=A0A4C1XPE5_EUMVA|nr:Aminopeptidase N [Eumeta japonica]
MCNSFRKFKTFTRDDIWSSLHAAAKEDGKLPDDVHVNSVAESWYFKEALPLITAERNYDTNSVTVRQKLYLRERPHNVRSTDGASWWVPIVIARGDHLNFTNSTPDFWMNDSTTYTGMPSKKHFIIINPEEIAPFLVNYDKDNWNLLSEYLQKDERLRIPELTRAKLLHDAWNLAYAGELSFATALNMTLFLSKERNHVVWDPVFTMIDHIGRHIDSSEVHTKFQAYVRALLSPLYEELIQEEERADEENWRKNLRSYTQNFLCKAGYRPCIRHAQVHFRKWVDAPNPDEGNPLPNQYICPVFKWGTKKEWEFGLQRVINFPSTRKQSERTYLLKTLAGCPVDADRIERLLNITVLEGNANFTETDLFLIFSMLTGNSKGYTTLFNFVNKNWDILKEKYSSKTNLWDNLISSATSRFTTQQGLDLVSGLYAGHKGEFGSAKHIIETSIKNIREEAQWSAENIPVIENWLDDYLAKIKLEDDDDDDDLSTEE